MIMPPKVSTNIILLIFGAQKHVLRTFFLTNFAFKILLPPSQNIRHVGRLSHQNVLYFGTDKVATRAANISLKKPGSGYFI
jgi:hypothetical protein